jgi:hypothetical protein
MLAPKTKKMFSVKQRESLTREDYSNTLAQRSTDKIEKLSKIKEAKDLKESQECTFKPSIYQNSKYKSIKALISSDKVSQSDKMSYYRVRKDRSPVDIEFEKQ